MIRSLWLIILAVIAAGAACHADQTLPGPAAFMGHWKITDIAGYADMGGGEPLGQQMVGTTLTITPAGMALHVVDHWSCEAVGGYEVREVDTAYLIDDSGARPQEVKLPAKAVRLTDKGDDCLQVFWIGKDRIEFDFLGVFVRASRRP